MNKELRRIIANIYVSFVGAICDSSFSSDSLSTKDIAVIDKFITELSKRKIASSMGKDEMIKYFIFQFDYWLNINPVKTDFKVFRLTWIIGSKALDRWINYPYKDLTKARGNLSKYDIESIITSIGEVNPTRSVVDIKLHEELEKKKFYNSPQGYVYCIEHTTLYNPLSPLCQECQFKEQCQIQLLINLPSIYSKRGLIPPRNKTRRT